ncbi:hypothetical protein [Clostridium sp.]|uniref:hypothetical protein n=1 Tax=Clostridium sp. TaxID=1506 RepID=UPI001A572EFC|nr:hypothetical protein [Clostridium sp.]MBK5240556.1 hypothetical protein [Clostridium sp.]
MAKFIIYTDGNYRNNKGGFGVKIINTEDDKGSIILYGKSKSNGSYQSEVAAVSEGLNFFNEKIIPVLNGQEYFIELRIDLLSIIKIFNCHGYKKIKKRFSNSERIPKINENQSVTLKLINLFDTFAKGCVRFKKVNKKDINNVIVDKFAAFAIKSEPIESYERHILMQEHVEEALSVVEMSELSNFHINEELIDKSIKNIIESSKLIEKQDTLIKLYADNKVNTIMVPVNKIIVTESIHLNCKTMAYNGGLKKIAKTGNISRPVVVRDIGNGYYSLICGALALFSAKIVSLDEIPVLITTLNIGDFREKYSLYN